MGSWRYVVFLLIILINYEHRVAVRKKFTHSQKAEKKFLLVKNFPLTTHHFSKVCPLVVKYKWWKGRI